MKLLAAILFFILPQSGEPVTTDVEFQRDSLLHQYDLIKNRSKNADRKVVFLLEASQMEYEMGNFTDALKYAKIAKGHFKEGVSESKKARTFNTIGNYNLRLGDYSKAMKNYRYAFELYEQLDDLKRQSVVLSNIGVVFEKLENNHLALEYNLKVLEIKLLSPDKKSWSISYTNIGNNYMEIGEYDMALAYYQKALEIDSILNDVRGISADYNNIGILYSTMKDFDEAIQYYKTTFAIDSSLDDHYGMALSLYNIAFAWHEAQYNEKALHYANRSLSEARSINSLEYQKNNLELLSRIYEDKKMNDTTLDVYKEYTSLLGIAEYEEDSEENITEEESTVAPDNLISTPTESSQTAHMDDFNMKTYLFYGLITFIFGVIVYTLIIWISKSGL